MTSLDYGQLVNRHVHPRCKEVLTAGDKVTLAVDVAWTGPVSEIGQWQPYPLNTSRTSAFAEGRASIQNSKIAF
jgi:hypothetical protein